MSWRRGAQAPARCRLGRPLAAAVGLCVALALSGATGDARADETSATEAFRAGEAAYARGEYRAAALSFEAAFREQPHAAALYNAGRSWGAAGALPRAADAYAAALRASGLDAAQEADARTHLQELEASLGMVTVTAPAGTLVSLDHVERAPAPVLVHVTSGDHTARADLADGRAITRSVRVGAGERVTLAFAAPARVAPAAPSPGAVKPGAGPQSAGHSGLWPLGWASLGGAALAGGTAIFLGVSALDARDTFDASNHTDQAAHDQAAALRAWTNLTWATAGALGVVGIVLLATSNRTESSATLHVTPGGAALSGSF